MIGVEKPVRPGNLCEMIPEFAISKIKLDGNGKSCFRSLIVDTQGKSQYGPLLEDLGCRKADRNEILNYLKSVVKDSIANKAFREQLYAWSNYEFDKVLSEHNNMLDSYRIHKPYSEEQLRKLVDREFNVLGLLVRIFENSIGNDNENLIFCILSLLSMFMHLAHPIGQICGANRPRCGASVHFYD